MLDGALSALTLAVRHDNTSCIRHPHKYITAAAVAAADSKLTCLFYDSGVMLLSPHHPSIHLSIHQFLRPHADNSRQCFFVRYFFASEMQRRNIFTGSIARSANLPVFSLLRGRF